ncbi:MAG: hypothetical protein ACLSHG_10505 [Oscillospiraceae bacterium]
MTFWGRIIIEQETRITAMSRRGPRCDAALYIENIIITTVMHTQTSNTFSGILPPMQIRLGRLLSGG